MDEPRMTLAEPADWTLPQPRRSMLARLDPVNDRPTSDYATYHVGGIGTPKSFLQLKVIRQQIPAGTRHLAVTVEFLTSEEYLKRAYPDDPVTSDR